MNPTLDQSSYVISLDEIFWGGILVAITMAMHGFGMLLVHRVNYAIKQWIGKRTGILANLLPVIFASWMIMLVHLIEVAVWAGFFLWRGAFPNHSLAYYFSLNEYTTVGSNFNLPLHWRLLEGMLAMTGLLTFAWSTGVLITLAQEFQELRLQLFRQRHDK
jgi:hypothetical protein